MASSSRAGPGVFASSIVGDLTSDKIDSAKNEPTQFTTPPNSQSPREDKWAFSITVKPDLECITRLPPETLDQIFGYIVLDHDPERGTKIKRQGHAYRERPHALLYLAAMCKHLYQHADAFAQNYLKKHQKRAQFRTTGLGAYWNSKRWVPHAELVKALETRCFQCGGTSKGLERAVMINGVVAHSFCAESAFTKTIVSLPEREMLDATVLTILALVTVAVRSHEPLQPARLHAAQVSQARPRQKKYKALPKIEYGTYKNATYFDREDVEMISAVVHGGRNPPVIEREKAFQAWQKSGATFSAVARVNGN